jgi:hypothetical protein
MADPTNRNDPTYAHDSHYVWSGGGWRYRGDGTIDPNRPAPGGSVHAESLGTQGGWAGLFSGSKPVVTQSSIPNAAHWQQVAQQGAKRVQMQNPYDAAYADQSRGSQMALINQMRAQMNGPSIAAMQGQGAMGQLGQQALMQGGRAGMLGAAQQGAGIGNDVAQARLAEIMRAQAGMGGALGQMRGSDLQSANTQLGAGLTAQQQADKSAQFYASLGSNMGVAQDRMALENYKLNERLKKGGAKSTEDGLNDYLSILKMAAAGGA